MGPSTWLVAAATVVIVGGGTTAAVLGLRSGGAEAGPPPSVIDECLMGRWEQTDLATEISAQGETHPTTGWNGRVVEFRPDGTQVVQFDDAEVTRELAGNGDTYQPEGLSQPLKYTCDETTRTQWTTGFEATFERLD